MKPNFQSLAIPTLATVYMFAGVYIGCGQQGGNKNPKSSVAPVADKSQKIEETKDVSESEKKAVADKNASQKKAKKPTGSADEDEEETEDDTVANKSKSKRNIADEEEEDEEDSSSGSGSNSKSQTSLNSSQTSLMKSICGKRFSELDKQIQERIKEYAGNRIDEKFLRDIKLTNCKVDSKGVLTFDIDLGGLGSRLNIDLGNPRDSNTQRKSDDDDN